MNSHDYEELEPYKSPSAVPTRNPLEMEGERTTLTGNPIPDREHDNHTTMMTAEGGFGMGAAGANLLPPGYTDKSLVRIPIRQSDLEPEPEEAENSDVYSPEIQMTKKGVFGGLFKGLKNKTSSSRQRQREGGFQMVMMSRGDYLKYWAKGDDGKFLPNVQEPPGGRKEWLQRQLEINEEWKRNDPSLGETKEKDKMTAGKAMVNWSSPGLI